MSKNTATTTKATATKATAATNDTHGVERTRKPSRAVTVTSKAKSDLTVPRGLASATVKAFTVKGNIHRQRADVIRRIRNLNGGLSIRGAVAVMTVALDGYAPDGFSKGNVERYYVVLDALATMADKGPELAGLPLADRDQIVADLFRIAGPGGGKDAVNKAAAAACATKNPAMVPVILGQHKAAVNAANVALVTRKPNRPVGGEAADGGKRQTPASETTSEEAATDAPATATDATPAPQRDGLALIAELTRMASAPGFRPTEALTTAFDNLAMVWEEAAATVDA